MENNKLELDPQLEMVSGELAQLVTHKAWEFKFEENDRGTLCFVVYYELGQNVYKLELPMKLIKDDQQEYS